MKKSDLKSGMVVEYRDGRKRLVVNDDLIGDDGSLSLTYYNDDLKDNEYSVLDSDFDIIKVYRYKDNRSLSYLLKDDNLELIWERKDNKLTNKELKSTKDLIENIINSMIMLTFEIYTEYIIKILEKEIKMMNGETDE